MAEVSGLEERALERKAKLQALRAKRDGVPTDNLRDGESTPGKPVLKFRNYTPSSSELKEKQLPKVKPENVEEHIPDHMKLTKDKEEASEVNLTNLAPRKPDWDLKRDIAKKLSKLERRTQRAIVEITRERILEEQKSENPSSLSTDLAAVVSAAVDNREDYDSD
jgi:coiled-coil domain-containing protein 12